MSKRDDVQWIKLAQIRKWWLAFQMP